MVHHGHKTEERAHVLINKAILLNGLGARKKYFLCLSFIALSAGVSLTPVASHAQSGAVYNNSAGQTEIRIQQMETQIRKLTGKVEKQSYEINALNLKLKNLNDIKPPQMNAPVSNKMGEEVSSAPQASSSNPLGLDFAAQDPKGMQTKTVVSSNNNATAQYEKAYADLKMTNYEDAEKGFEQFLNGHSDHVLAANAKYWLGETFYARGNFKKAARIFAEGFQTYPESAKSADILLKLGLSLKGLDKNNDACVALGQVPVKFPLANEAILKRAEQERNQLSCDA